MSNSSETNTFSCEFFPPRTEAGMENLIIARNELKAAFDPAFYSVTFGAGGSTRDGTIETIDKLRKASDDEVAPHISCIGSKREDIDHLLESYVDRGIKRLVTLRGDLPEASVDKGDFGHANELVEYIRTQTGDQFYIEVAAYPECHPESPTPESDLLNFKKKIDAGADSVITQYFFNIEAFWRFIDNCNSYGIETTVIPGIMPITNYKGLVRFSERCGADIPLWIRKQLEAYQDDTDSLYSFGQEVVTKLCQQLLDGGVKGLHFYTLNKSSATINIWNNLDL